MRLSSLLKWVSSFETDFNSEKIGPKKHKFRRLKVPYILVVGAQEAGEGTVNVNDRDGKNLGTIPLETFLERCSVEIHTKGRKQEALQPA